MGMLLESIKQDGAETRVFTTGAEFIWKGR